MTADRTSPLVSELYRNQTLLDSVAEYALRHPGAAVPPEVPGLSELARKFLTDWQGVVAVKLWLRLAQPTLDALRSYVELDLARAPDEDVDADQLAEALDASRIAVQTLVERLEFHAERWAARAAS